MNFLDMKAGETVEIGTQKAFRFWRYVYPPHDTPVRLLSWVSDKRWFPHQPVEGTTPDKGEQGIHGFKTMDDLMTAIAGESEWLVMRSLVSGCDGVMIGEVDLWGIIWDHTRGYRAQFARPRAFLLSHGNRSEQALVDLREMFFG